VDPASKAMLAIMARKPWTVLTRNRLQGGFFVLKYYGSDGVLLKAKVDGTRDIQSVAMSPDKSFKG